MLLVVDDGAKNSPSVTGEGASRGMPCRTGEQLGRCGAEPGGDALDLDEVERDLTVEALANGGLGDPEDLGERSGRQASSSHLGPDDDRDPR